ncbi:uncharacterized protein BYT42DRAFT_610997 [Radiomyces spectabilis]|uniref:uncharacterized protein n=1 Tax=Radiomyces spectabilis TaxID=64574 RepID=UPI0022211F96|nr:uncharacterized protein BYT42DRAFT_610997 [Radiomyces spectabilis]KAI8391812.1 hypothetical protein BYT42DRAFT_610997 [Radiomyces spectabilis]
MSYTNELLLEWTKAVEINDLQAVQTLLQAHGELLWEPVAIPVESDYAHLLPQLDRLQLLGTSFEPLYAIQYLLLEHLESDNDTLTDAQIQRSKLLEILLEHTSSSDLNTYCWGANNTTLHLASFLGQKNMVRSLLEKGALPDIPNDLGYTAKDVAQTNQVAHLLAPSAQSPKPSKSTPSDRFRQLRDLAESSGGTGKLAQRQNSTHRYFRPGHIEERRKKVLNEEEEAELEKARSKRQKEVDQIAKRSAVKNNPFMKQLEQQQQQQNAKSPHTPHPLRKHLINDNLEFQLRRDSKVISSLKDKSYVSASVFRKARDMAEQKPSRSMSEFATDSKNNNPKSGSKTDPEASDTDDTENITTNQSPSHSLGDDDHHDNFATKSTLSAGSIDEKVEKDTSDAEDRNEFGSVNKETDSQSDTESDTATVITVLAEDTESLSETGKDAVSADFTTITGENTFNADGLYKSEKETAEEPASSEPSEPMEYVAKVGSPLTSDRQSIGMTRSIHSTFIQDNISATNTEEPPVISDSTNAIHQFDKVTTKEPLPALASQDVIDSTYEETILDALESDKYDKDANCIVNRLSRESKPLISDAESAPVTAANETTDENAVSDDEELSTNDDTLENEHTYSSIVASTENISRVDRSSYSPAPNAALVSECEVADGPTMTAELETNEQPTYGASNGDAKYLHVDEERKRHSIAPSPIHATNFEDNMHITSVSSLSRTSCDSTIHSSATSITEPSIKLPKDWIVEGSGDQEEATLSVDVLENSAITPLTQGDEEHPIEPLTNLLHDDDSAATSLDESTAARSSVRKSTRLSLMNPLTEAKRMSMKQRMSQTTDESKRFSGSQRSHWSVGMNLWSSVLKRESIQSSKRYSVAQYSETDSEQWFDSQEDWLEHETEMRRSLNPPYILSQNDNDHVHQESDQEDGRLRAYLSLSKNETISEVDAPEEISVDQQRSDSNEDLEAPPTMTRRKSHEDLRTEANAYAEDVDTFVTLSTTQTPLSEPVENVETDDVAQEFISDRISADPTEKKAGRNDAGHVLVEYGRSRKGSVSSDNGTVQDAPATTQSSPVDPRSSGEDSINSKAPSSFSTRPPSVNGSVDTWIPVSPSSTDIEPTTKESTEATQERDFGSVSVRSTSRYVSRVLNFDPPDPAKEVAAAFDSKKIELLPDDPYHEQSRTPTQETIQSVAPVEPPTPAVPSYGKLYVHVCGAYNLLLPLPKETTYVRCVISDGKYEYMSRYEVLGQHVMLDYECIVDANPDMIVTVALHVRPDYHVKPRTGLSKWLTSIRKQKESISGYVHPDDGAIGQTRFALAHMIQACSEKRYDSNLDCFNSWYARSARERQRQQQLGDDDVLKVVGNLAVSMLYLPMSDPAQTIPKNLHECDLMLKIRQWHETCWHSGYLSIRMQGTQVWVRRYYRLTGSQLVGYSPQTPSWQPVDRYDIADVVRLSAATDQILVTLVDLPDRVFQPEPICEDNQRGFFRISFPDFYVDCVSDKVEESEEWLKALRSMIGRVPQLQYSVFPVRSQLYEIPPISEVPY